MSIEFYGCQDSDTKQCTLYAFTGNKCVAQTFNASGMAAAERLLRLPDGPTREEVGARPRHPDLYPAGDFLDWWVW